MSDNAILLRILLSILFGAIIGLESETRRIEKIGKKQAEKKERSIIGGLRTYTVLSMMGSIAAIFYIEGIFYISYLIFTAVVLLIVSAYILNVQIRKAFGITTEIAIIITFLLGFMTTASIVPLVVSLVILVLLTSFLSHKTQISSFVQKIQHKELIGVMQFAIVSLVVLPILPDTDYLYTDLLSMFGLDSVSNVLSDNIRNLNIINPFKMWLIVVIISGLNLLGYLLGRIFGRDKGIFFTGLFGGLISSTSTTVTMANRSKEAKSKSESSLYAGAALTANATSFLDTFFIIAISSSALLTEIYPSLFLMFVIGLIVGGWLIWKYHWFYEKSGKKIEIKYHPFSVAPAIKFVGLIVFIKIAIQMVSFLDAENLLLATTSLSGITGLDAPLIAVSDLITSAKVSLGVGTNIFLLTNLVNYITKGVLGYTMGSREFAKYLIIGLLITLTGSFVILLL